METAQTKTDARNKSHRYLANFDDESLRNVSPMARVTAKIPPTRRMPKGSREAVRMGLGSLLRRRTRRHSGS